jgi:hypothetical protein
MKGILRLDEVRPERHNWIWADRIARQELHFLAGRKDGGKSMMCAKIAADVSWGRDAITGEPGALSYLNPKQRPLQPMNVLYSAAEDTAGTMTRPRLEAQGARHAGIHLWRFRLPLQFEELADIIIEKSIDLVIMDPLASHLSGGVNRYGDTIRIVTDPLKELMEATNAACLVVDHVRKHVGPNAEPMDAVGGGSSGFPAACRCGFLFGKNPADDDQRVLSMIKHNVREKPLSMMFELDQVEVKIKYEENNKKLIFEDDNVPKLIFQGEDYFNPIRVVSNERGKLGRGRPADKRAQACEWLTQYLWEKLAAGDGSYPTLGTVVQEDALQAGMSYRTVRRAADDMKIIKSGKGGTGVTWSLPSAVIDMLTGEIDNDDRAPEPKADMVGEEPALKRMLDANPDPTDDKWERNKPAAAADDGKGDSEPSAEFDAEFDSFLANLEGGDDDATQA